MPLTPAQQQAYDALADAIARDDRILAGKRLVELGALLEARPITIPAPQAPDLPPLTWAVTSRNEYHACTFAVADSEVQGEPEIVFQTHDGIRRRGYNASFLPRETGLVQYAVNGVKSSRRLEFRGGAPFAPRTIKPGNLDAELAKGGDIRLEAGEYTITRVWDSKSGPLKNVTVVGAGRDKTRIIWKVKRLLGYHACDLRDSAFHGVDMIGPVDYDPAKRGADEWDTKKKGTDGFNLTGSNTFSDCRFTNWDKAITVGKGADGTLIQRCEGRKLKSYFVWLGEGKNTAIYDCDVDNSVFEHCIRGGGWNGVAINGGRLQNLDNRANPDPKLRDPKDDAKGTFALQWGTRAYVWNVTTIGPAGVGPLAVPAGGKASERASRVVVEDCNLSSGLELWGGLENFRVTNTPIRTFEHRDDRTIRNGIVPAGTKIPAKPVAENVRAA